MILSKDLKQLDLAKELVLIDNVNMPFTSLLLKNTQKVTSTIVNWDYKNLDSTKGLAIEGSDVDAFQATDRVTGNSNVCQILRKAVNVSDTAQAVSAEHISDLFAQELADRILEIKRDLEYYLINGVKDDGTTGNARQMDGLLEFINVANTVKSAEFGLPALQEMAKLMRQKGTASQNLVLLCDYNYFDIVANLFEDKTFYRGVTNEFGSPVQKINLTYGSIIPYVIDAMPENTAIMANTDFLRIGELRPLHFAELAKSGSSTKGMIEMENTIKVLHPHAIVGFDVQAG